jgi:3-hydroxyisobutyrate dehydrogenase-like beta-hydroxyacid dehydrogenase
MHHPNNQPTVDLRSAGAIQLETPLAVAEQSDAIVICVNGSPQVEEVVLGAAGLLEGLKPGAVVIDCSTSHPDSTRRLAQAIALRHALMLDAAMTRTPREAALGKLNLLVGGDSATLEQCRPLLACFAESLTHVGPIGTGHQMKLIHNFASIGSLVLLAEAAAVSRAADIQPSVFVKILVEGGAWGAALERLRPYLLESDVSALRFSLSNALKDLSYYCKMLDQGSGTYSIAEAVHSTLINACEAGDTSLALPTIVDLIEARVSGHPARAQLVTKQTEG